MRVSYLVPVLALAAACPPPPGDGPGGDPPETVALGGIFLLQDRTPFWQASASFTQPVASTCEVEEVAGCTVTTCNNAGDAAPIAPTGSLDAGAITIQSQTHTPVTLTRDGDGLYATQRGDDEELFENGAELIAEAAGGDDVAAFELTLNAPTPLQMTNPPLASVTVRVTEALPFEWTGPSRGDVTFLLSNGLITTSCRAESSAGAYAIPAEIIGRYPLGEGSLTIDNVVSVDAVLADSQEASFFVSTQPTSATGINANYFVTFAAP